MPARDDARQYRQRAVHCLEMARDATGARKLVLLRMAQAWARLAEKAERPRHDDVLAEAPPAKPDQHRRPKPKPAAKPKPVAKPQHGPH